MGANMGLPRLIRWALDRAIDWWEAVSWRTPLPLSPGAMAAEAQKAAADEQVRYIRRTRELERRIDEVGRSAVFARARAIGWRDECPPLWVWECIVAEMLAERRPSQRTAEVLH